MATPSEPSPRASKSRAKKTRAADPGERVISRTVTKEVRRVDGLATDGLTTDGLSTDGLSTDGLSTDGLSTDGLSTAGLSTRGLPTDASEPQRRELVEITAYYLAERRDFEPGHELEDWIAAEVLVNGMRLEK
jgi:hypothetical protein